MHILASHTLPTAPPGDEPAPPIQDPPPGLPDQAPLPETPPGHTPA